MTIFTFVVGGLLTLTGVVTYGVTGAASITALIPAFVGILMLVCAGIATKESLHRHGIHAALVVALIGALGSLMNVVKIGDLFAGTAERPAAIVESLIMFVATVVYVGAGVRSFIMARRNPQT